MKASPLKVDQMLFCPVTSLTMNNNKDSVEDIRTIYNEICRAHDAIADFRAKLLGLLPLASGASIFLLIGNDALSKGNNERHLIPIGVFGILISLGLFAYELRGIQKCRGLIQSAKMFEKRLLLQENLWEYATFNASPSSLWGIVGATGAALIIYPTVVAAWMYILIVGVMGRVTSFSGFAPLIAASLALFLAFGLGKYADKQNQKALDSRLKSLQSNDNA